MTDSASAAPGPPVARFRLELVITGNTMTELADELHVQSNDFAVEVMNGRQTLDQAGGRHHLIVEERNPGMTPAQYDDELGSWWAGRRTVGRGGPEMVQFAGREQVAKA